ncbi:flavodoxin domain-containing protein [uncultured Tateyamaria sp.]|uniref:flavodoxin domain-containing protein n=1 Tax=Tateyamaria sp. 1078 TaxID=3417464 RepID=UPI00262BA643|nr:flavodoxin domain-containing protein [uncultured Tateyamaria sp.]
MTVLILFESVEGHTAKVAEYVSNTVQALGHATHVVDLGGNASVDFDDVSHVVLAASVHQRRHPRQFEAAIAAHGQALERLPTLTLSVSLSAAFPEGREEAQDYLDEMKMRTGVHPTREALVAGAVQTAKYDYFAMQVVRYVVLKGREFDTSAPSHVFTDWEALRATVTGFLATAA